MATIIPRTQGPITEVQDIPGVRNTAQVDMSPVVRGIGAVTGAANDFFQQQKERADLTALMQARRELSDWESTTFDPGNQNGINRFKGKEALRANEALLPDLDSHVGKIRQRLTPEQQARFDQISGNFRDSLQGRLNGYMDREYQQYERAEQKATLDNLGADAVTAGVSGDFARQATIATEVLAMNRLSLANQGFGEEAIKASERGIVSSIHKQTIDGMMTGDPYAAQSYLERFADQMSPQDYAQAERALYPVVADTNQYNIAEQIMGGVSQGEDLDMEAIDQSIIGLESGGSDTAKNPNSSATGAGQFIDSTWLSVVKRHRSDVAVGKTDEQILALRTDGDLSREMVSRYREDNARELQAKGVRPTATNLYAAHHFGAGGGAKFAQASADTLMSSILPKRDYAANPYLHGKTKADVLENWSKRGLSLAPAVGAADTAVVTTTASASPPATFGEAVARIPRSLAPRDVKGVEAYLRDMYAARKSQIEAAEQATSMSVYDKVTQANPTQSLSTVLSPEEMAFVGRTSSLNESINRFRKLQSSGQIIEDDPVVLDRIYRLQATQPTEFAKLKLAEYGDRLSGKTMKELASAQSEAGNPSKRADWMTDDERISAGLRSLGLGREGDARGGGSEKKNEPRDKQRGEFRIAYNNAASAFVQQQGKKPTPEQADVLMRTVTKQFAERITAGTTGVYSSGEQFAFRISEADRAAVRDAYRAKYGANPTDAWVTQYVARKRGNANE